VVLAGYAREGVEILESIVNVANKIVWGLPESLPWLVGLLLLAGLTVTLRLAFIQLRQLKHALLVTIGRFDDPNDPGDVSHFQALSTALSATVGIGNIAGVATAIHYGGPGAVFWMWVTALFGMALKFTECTLAIRYRSFDDRGESAGGPMYYIEKGLGPRWKPLAMFFAFCAIIASFGGGNMNQANTVAVSAASDFGITSWIVGAVLVVAVGAVILGGIKSIAKVASTLAPTMAAVYVIGALTVLLLHVGEIPGAFATIIEHAFNPRASVGGSVAGVFSLTLLWGVKRGLFSNEAGQGSAPIAHAAAKTNEPVREGAVAMLGPLIDTLLICTMTALVIVVTGVWDKKKDVELPLGDPNIEVRGDEPADEHFTVVESGRAPGLSFAMNDGLLDAYRLVDGEGKLYNGHLVLVYDVEDEEGEADGKVKVSSLAAYDGTELMVEGMALQNSSALTAWGFQVGLSKFGDWGNLVVTFCVFLFALSTMVSWSYYGDRCVTYLFGSKYVIYYRLVFIAFVFVGSVTALETVWAYGDLALGLMTVPNLIAIVLLLPKVIEMSRDYFARMKKLESVPKAEVKDE
jgi:AGCS family alanine or glycine:cation symporter